MRRSLCFTVPTVLHGTLFCGGTRAKGTGSPKMICASGTIRSRFVNTVSHYDMVS